MLAWFHGVQTEQLNHFIQVFNQLVVLALGKLHFNFRVAFVLYSTMIKTSL